MPEDLLHHICYFRNHGNQNIFFGRSISVADRCKFVKKKNCTSLSIIEKIVSEISNTLCSCGVLSKVNKLSWCSALRGALQEKETIQISDNMHHEAIRSADRKILWLFRIFCHKSMDTNAVYYGGNNMARSLEIKNVYSCYIIPPKFFFFFKFQWSVNVNIQIFQISLNPWIKKGSDLLFESDSLGVHTIL